MVSAFDKHVKRHNLLGVSAALGFDNVDFCHCTLLVEEVVALGEGMFNKR